MGAAAPHAQYAEVASLVRDMAREMGGVEEAARRGGDEAREELLRVGGLLDISRRELDISRRELEGERLRQVQLEDLLRVQSMQT